MIRMLLAVLVLAGVGNGCILHGPGPEGHHRVYGPWIDIEAGHLHSDTCGHYSHGSRWYQDQSHHHGAGCGHARRDGAWIIVH